MLLQVAKKLQYKGGTGENQRRKDKRRQRGFKQKCELHLKEWPGAAGWRSGGWVKDDP